MQAPYGGTPIASDLQTCPELRPLAKAVIGGAMKGDFRALTDLSYETRMAFVARLKTRRFQARGWCGSRTWTTRSR